MLLQGAQLAARLDGWLKSHIGWPYNSLLGTGLGMGIVATVNAIDHALTSPTNLAALGATLLFQIALLINQLAQLHEMREAGRARRAERRARRAAATRP